MGLPSEENEKRADGGDGAQRTPPRELQFASTTQIWKNALVVSLGFMFLFTSFQSLSNLQSSLYDKGDDSLGTAGMSVIYGALIVSCMLVPSALIDRLGCKWTVVVSMCCYVLYMVANFYARWYTIIPASVFVGLGAAPLWSAKCAYLTDASLDYARKTGDTPDGAVNTFFGFFFLFFQTSQIWGNTISSTILSQRPENASEVNVTDAMLATCGANWSPALTENGNETNPNLQGPEMSQIYMLAGVYTGCACLGILIVAVFLDQLPSERGKKRSGGCVFSGRLLVATFMHMRDTRQLLLIPLTMYSGLEQAFITGDYTKAFVGCPLGIWNIGYIMICYGIVDSLCSFGFGRLVQLIGRVPFFVFGAALSFGLHAAFYVWLPSPNQEILIYVFAGLWGMTDAIWQTQINALYGVLFKENAEAGFANYRLWESLGFTIAFAYAGHIGVAYKLAVLIGVLALGMAGYLVIEVRARQSGTGNVSIEYKAESH